MTVEQAVEELIDILKLEKKPSPGDVTQWHRKGLVDIKLTDGKMGRPDFFTFSQGGGLISLSLPTMRWTGTFTPKEIVMTYGECFLSDSTSTVKPLWMEAARKYMEIENDVKTRIGDDGLLDAINL